MSFGDTGFGLVNQLKQGSKRYYGKYRGIVTNIDDPKKKGRLKANVPSITGKFDTGWALPALTPGSFIMPKEGTGVWIEFEEGNPSLPVWTGIWLADGETLEDAVEVGIIYDPVTKKVKVYGQTGMTCEVNGFDELKVTGQKVTIDSANIELGGQTKFVLDGATTSTDGSPYPHSHTITGTSIKVKGG